MVIDLEQLGIHRIDVPSPFFGGQTNVFLIEGPPLTLVDAGPNSRRTLQALVEGLERRGHRLEEVQRVVITHPHVDHYGLVEVVASRSRAEVYAHRANRYWIEGFNALQSEKRKANYLRCLVHLGLPPELVRAMTGEFRAGREYRSYTRVHHLLRGGERLPFRGFELQAFHLPGHTPGCLCLYDPKNRLLFSGDFLLQGVSPNPLLHIPTDEDEERPMSLVNYLHSLRRVQKMAVDLALPGHGELIWDPQGTIAQQLEHCGERRDRVARLLQGRGPTTPFELSRLLFGELPLDQVYAGLSEAVAYLDVLKLEGEVEEQEKDGVLYYEIRQKKF